MHTPKDWRSLKGFHVISFCNSAFLNNIKEIKRNAITTTFVNCMTWCFPKEIRAQREGLIDFHLYQTDHAFQKIKKHLQVSPYPYRPLTVKPYFDVADFPFKEDRRSNEFRFGRVSRGDADKYSISQFKIYEMMVSPNPKRGILLGFDERARKKMKRNPPDYIKTYPECGITQQQFYDFCDVFISTSDTFENLPRVGFEAMASGSVLITDNRGGWRMQVENGKTGYLCNDPLEFIYRSSRLAFEEQEQTDMRHAAREKLEQEWGMEASMQSWDRVFTEWQKRA